MTARKENRIEPAGIDPATHSDPPRLGELTAEIVSNVQFRRQVERLCRHPRLVVELLAELGAERSIRVPIEEKLARYAALSDEALAAAGGDRMQAIPLHEVE